MRAFFPTFTPRTLGGSGTISGAVTVIAEQIWLPARRKYEASSGKIRQSEISLVLLWQNAISRKIKNRSERWNQGAAFL